MNDNELDQWLSTHNEQLDAQINARVSVELRRQQVRSAAASAPHVDEPEMDEVHAIWSEQAARTGPAPRRGPGGRTRRSTTRPASTRSTRRSATHPGPGVSVPGGGRRSVDATRSLGVILAVFCLLVSSALVGDFANQWSAAPPSPERAKSMVIGVATNARNSGTNQDDHRYGFAYELATWLAGDLNYSPVTLFSFLDLDNHADMLRRGQVDMIFSSNPTTGKPGAEISFAGPYLVIQGGFLVRAGSTAIHTSKDLDGKRVCTWSESTYDEQSRRLGGSVSVEDDSLSSCVDSLLAGDVDAVAGDQLLLSEIASAQESDTLSVVPGLNFGGRQRYGIELAFDDVGDCNEIRDALRRFITSGAWDHVFQANMPDLPPAAPRPDPDHLDRCG